MEGIDVIWQPVVLILPARLECGCGQRAIFVLLTPPDDGERAPQGGLLHDYTAYCQDCWVRDQEAEPEGITE